MNVERKEGRKPLLVFCHGLGAAKDSGIVDRLYHALPNKAIRFDFAGFGDAQGPFTGLTDQVRQLTTLLDNQEEDAVLIGHSLGATTALLTEHPRARAKILIGAPTRPDATRENPHIIAGATFRDAHNNPYTIPQLFVTELHTLRAPPQTTPILSIYGSNDDTVPPRHAPTTPVIVEDNHDFEDTTEEIMQHINTFLENL